LFGFFKQRRREQVRHVPFPAVWEEIIARNCPGITRLSEADRAELRGDIQVFLAEKTFEGCAGLEMNDEIRVTIAAQACLLLLHRPTDDYPRLVTILVYSSAYVAKGIQPLSGGFYLEGEQVRLGEARHEGVVVLSWDDVRSGAVDVRDGHNVVLHEFAHQLDFEDGVADGAPVLARRSNYVAWARVLGEEYRRLCQGGRKSVLDRYGATDPAEFFAVATECFFEKPAQMKKKHPELYEELKEYYCQDPEAWSQRAP